jgi:NADPH-dependent curcumin reductase CurA
MFGGRRCVALKYFLPLQQSNETNTGQNIMNVVTMRIKMQGFIVFDFLKDYPGARKDLARWLDEGKIKRKETIVKGGLKAAEEALVGLYKGINTGKLIVEIKNPNEASKL